VDRFGDLHRQLSRRHEDQRARAERFARAFLGQEAVQERQRERRRLPRSRPRLPDGVRPASSTGIASRWMGVGSS
jgi:hypothetical protein